MIYQLGICTTVSFLVSVSAATDLAAQTSIDSLLPRVKAGILWSAGHERGDMSEWSNMGFKHPGGGVLNTGGPDVSGTASQERAHSGRWSAKTVITGAYRGHKKRAVRLMRWTNRAWDDGGNFLPDEAYYSTWIYFPHVYNPNKYRPWDPGDGGWWNVFQFKSEDGRGISQPVWILNVGHDDVYKDMVFYLYSPENRPSSYRQPTPLSIPIGRWVHVEAFYRSATGRNGRISVWQDGRMILDARDVITSLGGKSGRDTHPIWGIGNYTDHIAGDPAGDGVATVYFDDAAISRNRVSGVVAEVRETLEQP